MGKICELYLGLLSCRILSIKVSSIGVASLKKSSKRELRRGIDVPKRSASKKIHTLALISAWDNRTQQANMTHSLE